MAEGGNATGGGAGSEYKLSATLEMRDQLSGKLRSAVSQIKSVDGAVSKLGNNGAIAQLSKQLDGLNNLRQQVNQFRDLRKSVAATEQAYKQTNNATAQLAREYKQGQAATAQLKAKQKELQKTFEQSQSATSQLKSKLSELKSEAAKAKSGMTEGYDKLQSKIQSTQSASAQLKSKLGELRAEAAKAKKSGAAEEYKNLQSQIKSMQSAAGQLKTQLGNLKAEAAKVKSGNASEAYRNLQAQIKSTSAELKASQAMTQKTGVELKSLASGIKQAERELGNIGSAFDRSKKKAAQLKQELKSQQPALSQMRQGLLSQGFNTRDFINSDRQLRERMAAATRDLRTQQLRETLSAAGMKLSGGNVNVNVNGNATSKLGAIRKELQSITQKTWNVAVNAKNAVGGKVNEFANGAMLGMGAQMLGTAGMGYSVVDAVKTYKDFEYEMKTVSAITGAYKDATGQRLAELTNLAKHYGETTMFKASEVASAEKYMAMAGWDDSYIKAGLKPVLDLATAAGEDLRRTSDIVTDAMTAFHLKPEEMYQIRGEGIKGEGKFVSATERFADVMAALATSSNTDVNMAGESAKYSAAIIGAMYGSQGIQDRMHGMEDWAVFQGLMADTGIKSSMAGTATRSIFTRLASMQMNADAARDILGVDLVYKQDDAEGHKAGQVRRSLDIIGDLRKKFQGGFESAEDLMNTIEYFDESGKRFTKLQRRKIGAMLESAQKNGGKMTDKDMLALTNMLSGQEALSGMLALITADDETWNKKIAAIQNAHGKAGEMSDVKMDTLEGDLKTLGSAFEAFQLELMTGSGAEGLRSFTQGLTEDIRAFKKSLEDGFNIGDIGSITAKVVTQLKNKFLEFDGVGSILAGGALAMGLKKLFNLTMQLKNAAMSMKDWYRGAATAPPTVGGGKGGGIAQSVGSMVVHASSVVVNGKAVAGGNTSTTATTAARNAGATTTSTTAATTASRLGGLAKIAGVAAVLTGIFSLFDLISTRTTNANRTDEAKSSIDELKKQQAQQTEEYQAAQKNYNEAVNASEATAEEIAALRDNVEKSKGVLDNTSQELARAESNLVDIKKETVKNNNESLLGGGGAVAGAAIGAAVGSAILPGIGTILGSIAGGYFGSEGGKALGEKFDFDVFGWLTGKNDKTPVSETNIAKADWLTSSGKKYSELDARGRIEYEQNKNAQDIANENAAKSAVEQQIKDQKHEDNLKRLEKGEVGDWALMQVKKEDIDSAIAANAKKKEQQRLGMNNAVVDQAPVVASMYGDQHSSEIAKISQEQGNKAKREALVERGQEVQRETKNQFLTEQANKTAVLNSISDFFKGVIEGIKNDDQIKADLIKSNKPDTPTAVDVGNSNFNPITGQQIITPATMPEFNISDILPDFSLSQWWSEKTAELANIDLTSALPDFSTIGTTISEQFSQIPTAATEAFNTISTSASEGLTSIQTAWNELPGFFDGLFAGLGGVATSAGAAIASGINSAIGTIQSAWESLSSWLSAKISSLSSMASNAASAVTSFVGGGGGVGHNATGTASWRGGFTEVNEQGGEIIDLPSGARIYPHATTMKMLQSDLQAGKLDEMIQSSGFGLSTPAAFEHDALGNIKGYSGMTDNLIQEDDLSPIREAKLQAQREFMTNQENQTPEFSAFPQAFDVSRLTQGITNNSTSNSTTTNNSGLTVTGNTFTINKGSDIDELIFKIFQMMSDAQANYAGA